MNPLWRTRLTAIACSLLAIAGGWWIAQGAFALPLLVAAICAAAAAVAIFRLPIDTLVLGGLLAGYVIGNRGFAQFSVVPGLPVLPGEVGLGLCLAALGLTSALARRLPIRRNALNLFIFGWIVIGTMRIWSDARAYGAVALRDFATVYYALFFFVAQAQMTGDAAAKFLQRTLLVVTVVVIPLFELFRRFTDFFLATLVFGGIPLIYFKGDLVATFMAVGVLLSHRRWEASRRAVWLIIALSGLFGVLFTGNRASLLGLVTATLWLAFGHRRALLRTLVVVTLAGGFILLGARMLGAVSARDNFALIVYERVLSIADVSGQRAYRSAEVEFKGDNNRFRLVWWQTVIEETIDTNPWLGLGFGHDLAAGFVRRYYPDSDEDFSTRSPHSIFVTVFGRMGAFGLFAFLGIVGAMLRGTWAALHAPVPDETHATAWLVPWIILVSACFGVVLEGPMGAVVFWTTLGMAAGGFRPVSSEENLTPAIEPNREEAAPLREVPVARNRPA